VIARYVTPSGFFTAAMFDYGYIIYDALYGVGSVRPHYVEL